MEVWLGAQSAIQPFNLDFHSEFELSSPPDQSVPSYSNEVKSAISHLMNRQVNGIMEEESVVPHSERQVSVDGSMSNSNSCSNEKNTNVEKKDDIEMTRETGFDIEQQDFQHFWQTLLNTVERDPEIQPQLQPLLKQENKEVIVEEKNMELKCLISELSQQSSTNDFDSNILTKVQEMSSKREREQIYEWNSDNSETDVKQMPLLSHTSQKQFNNWSSQSTTKMAQFSSNVSGKTETNIKTENNFTKCFSNNDNNMLQNMNLENPSTSQVSLNLCQQIKIETETNDESKVSQQLSNPLFEDLEVNNLLELDALCSPLPWLQDNVVNEALKTTEEQHVDKNFSSSAVGTKLQQVHEVEAPKDVTESDISNEVQEWGEIPSDIDMNMLFAILQDGQDMDQPLPQATVEGLASRLPDWNSTFGSARLGGTPTLFTTQVQACCGGVDSHLSFCTQLANTQLQLANYEPTTGVAQQNLVGSTFVTEQVGSNLAGNSFHMETSTIEQGSSSKQVEEMITETSQENFTSNVNSSVLVQPKSREDGETVGKVECGVSSSITEIILRESQAHMTNNGELPEVKKKKKKSDKKTKSNINNNVSVKHECIVCNKSFSERYNLNRHQKRVHHVKVKNSRYTNQVMSSEKPPEKTTDVKKEIVVNKKKPIVKDIIKPIKPNTKLTCDICKKFYQSKLTITKHMMTIHKFADKLFKCMTCNYSSPVRYDWRRHVFKHHSVVKPFKCTYCKKNYLLRKYYNLHMAAHHPGEIDHLADIPEPPQIVIDKTKSTKAVLKEKLTKKLKRCKKRKLSTSSSTSKNSSKHNIPIFDPSSLLNTIIQPPKNQLISENSNSSQSQPNFSQNLFFMSPSSSSSQHADCENSSTSVPLFYPIPSPPIMPLENSLSLPFTLSNMDILSSQPLSSNPIDIDDLSPEPLLPDTLDIIPAQSILSNPIDIVPSHKKSSKRKPSQTITSNSIDINVMPSQPLPIITTTNIIDTLASIDTTDSNSLTTNDETIGFPCEQCSKIFSTSRKLQTHIKNVHAEKTFHCNQCTYSATNNKYLKAHMKVHKKSTCISCNGKFKCDAELKNHNYEIHLTDLVRMCVHYMDTGEEFIQNENSNGDMNPYFCVLCQEHFETTSIIYQHLQTIHQLDQIIKCTTCNIYFNCSKNYEMHMKNVHYHDIRNTQ